MGVYRIRQSSQDVAAVMAGVGDTVTEMTALVEGIVTAVDGSGVRAVDGPDTTGLSQMAERLRAEANEFLEHMRR